MMSRFKLGIAIVALALLFAVLELGAYHFARTPLAQSLEFAYSGPLASREHQLLDRLYEWSSSRPEIRASLFNLAGLSVLWTLIKHLCFPALVLTTAEQGQGSGACWIRAQRRLLPMLVQEFYLLALLLPVAALLAIAIVGLSTPDPWAYRALLAVAVLWGMAKIVRDRCWALIGATQCAEKSPKTALRALASWWTQPATMLSAWMLWALGVLVAAGPLIEQISQRPGPAGSAAAFPYVAASFMLWALRQWLLLPPQRRRRLA